MSDFDSCQSNRIHTDGLHNWQASVNIWARSNATLDIGLDVVSVRTVGVRTLRHNQIVYQIFLPMVPRYARFARGSSAIKQVKASSKKV